MLLGIVKVTRQGADRARVNLALPRRLYQGDARIVSTMHGIQTEKDTAGRKPDFLPVRYLALPFHVGKAEYRQSKPPVC